VIPVGQRCANHPGREAAARCPRCRSYFCRECVTEHEDRVLCAACIRALTASQETAASPFLKRAATILPVSLGVLTAWLFFYLLGRGLFFRQPEAAPADTAVQESR
jgi:hypothetical protein